MKRIACRVLLLLLTACGNGATSDDAGPSGKPPGGTSAAEAPAAEGNPVDGEAFCAFLEATAPRLKAVGAPAGAKADFAVEPANWIGEHPEQGPRTAQDLDDVSQTSCPETRAEVVASMGATGFTEALGRRPRKATPVDTPRFTAFHPELPTRQARARAPTRTA
ncbi:hypothetical protein OG875_00145 [Streptomyces sp. NBC_01498]|uniref:hypothetical protein n=1 Tax=Streptomyces sp. NBC_01498 TaxID=2975870 RepID=UPI002E7BB90A|nr:hypothetical protein [Streptomyces sp. NBC_01498]WTL23139.1 hypothetical protein OG875_00145 [Streptomyces sp. NBC_01498]